MTAFAFLDLQRQIRQVVQTDEPMCWAIIANPMRGNMEEWRIVALFDTEASARAYVEASLIPPEVTERRTPGSDAFGGGTKLYRRTFRPDSLLYWFNREWGTAADMNGPRPREDIVFSLRLPLLEVPPVDDTTPINPAPPSGPCPPLEGAVP